MYLNPYVFVSLVVSVLAGIEFYFFYKKKKAKQTVDSMVKEFKKIVEIAHNRNRIIADELNNIIHWVNSEAPMDILNLVLENKELNEYREKKLQGADVFFTKFQSLIGELNGLFGGKVNTAYKNMQEALKEDVKNLTKE